MGFFRRIGKTFRRVSRQISAGHRRAIRRISRKYAGSQRRAFNRVSRSIKRTFKMGTGKFKKGIRGNILKKFTHEPATEAELQRLIDEVAEEAMREIEPEIRELKDDPTGEGREVLKAEIYREIFEELEALADEEDEEDDNDEDERRTSKKG